jgi:hypothetical protein
MKGYEPFSDREMGIFHDGPDGHGKGFLAGFALIEAVAVGFTIKGPCSLMAAMGADRAMGPKNFLHIPTGFFLCQLADFAQIHLDFPLYRIL